MRICWELCEGVAYLHAKKVVHRDLKSTNILLARNKQVKIGDFGTSRELHGEEELMRTHIGTPLYMAPEIISRKPYSQKADIWSLGCLLYYVATLKHPFQNTDLLSLYFSVLHERPKMLEMNDKVPAAFAQTVMRMLSRDANSRPEAKDVLMLAFTPQIVAEYIPLDLRREAERIRLESSQH